MYYTVRFKEILKEMKITGKTFSGIMEYDYDYYRKCTQNKRKNDVNWVKMFVMGYEMGKDSEKK